MGFTLIEMLLVLALIGLLASIAAPVVSGAVTRAREATLQQNLRVLRKLIDDFYADRGQLPPSLEILVKEGYLRAIPVDPVNGGEADWNLQMSKKGRGVEDVHSKSTGRGTNGVPYAEW
jgi:general secretion pathway protein G